MDEDTGAQREHQQGSSSPLVCRVEVGVGEAGVRGCSSWRTADGRARGRSSGAGAWVAGGRPERPHGRRRRQTGRALAAAAREGAERAGRRAGRLRSARRERRAAGAGETGAGPAICPVDPRGRRDPGPRGPREAARCLCRGLGRGRRVGFAGAQSRATGAVRGTLLLERTWAPSVSPVLTCVLPGEENASGNPQFLCTEGLSGVGAYGVVPSLVFPSSICSSGERCKGQLAVLLLSWSPKDLLPMLMLSQPQHFPPLPQSQKLLGRADLGSGICVV
ncbi:hypothetical protein J1605_021294 [Eschrichtius robustus]|uniref:Uncharacterized protein n=1 Tax=Eschrichtius robustus TaxID=9764 RepID=A0AB34HIP6_ESCRO|nr:hypothetical protein J1605_021294 [Eschrichtius robustus]